MKKDLLLGSIALFSLVVAAGEATAQPWVIGPYPVDVSQDEIHDTMFTWVQFTPVVNDRAGTAELRVSVIADMNVFPRLITKTIRTKYNQNNCGRYSVDNWVYDVRGQDVEIANRQAAKIKAAGVVSTWSCARGLDETVSEWDSSGCNIGSLTFGCYVIRTRRGSPIKTQNFSQGLSAYTWLTFSRPQARTLRLSYTRPIVQCDGDNIGNRFCDGLMMIFNNLGSVMADMVSQNGVMAQLPADTGPFDMEWDDAHFEYDRRGHPIMVVTAAAAISIDSLNAYMSSRFPGQWTNVSLNRAPGAKLPWTKRAVKEECKKLGRENDLINCAAAMGIPYDVLPP